MIALMAQLNSNNKSLCYREDIACSASFLCVLSILMIVLSVLLYLIIIV